MADKIDVSFSLASLEAEVNKEAQHEPVRVALSENKIISFKNPADVSFFTIAGAEAAEGLDGVTELFEQLLSEEDFEALKAENPSTRVVMALFEKVSAAYQDAGEAANKS